MRTYYTTLVEHYFRLALRHGSVSSPTAQKWLIFTQKWINALPIEDRALIESVFLDREKDFRVEYKALPFHSKEKLDLLEKRFAIAAKLCDKEV